MSENEENNTQERPIIIDSCACFADGSCTQSVGVGGWSYSISKRKGDMFKLQSINGKGAKRTTNQRMELFAMISLLEEIAKGTIENDPIEIYSDSEYVLRGMFSYGKTKKHETSKFVKYVHSKKCFDSTQERVKNKDLWEELWRVAYEVVGTYNLFFYWIRGHISSKGTGKKKGDMYYMHHLVDRRATLEKKKKMTA
jgi:ribonuclease HI